MARRLSVLFALLLGLVALSAAPASAEPTYGPTGGSVVVSSSTVSSGGSVVVRACGFQPGSTVTTTIQVNGQSRSGPSGTVNKKGCARLKVTLTSAGNNLILVSGTGANGAALVVSTNVLVTGAANSGSGLPRTGGDLTALWAGIALLIAGGALVGVTRSRRGARVPA